MIKESYIVTGNKPVYSKEENDILIGIGLSPMYSSSIEEITLTVTIPGDRSNLLKKIYKELGYTNVKVYKDVS